MTLCVLDKLTNNKTSLGVYVWLCAIVTKSLDVFYDFINQMPLLLLLSRAL